MKRIGAMSRGMLAAGCIAMAAVVLLSVNYISANTLHGVKADLTEDNLFTISEGTREVLGALEEPIDIRLYYTARLGDLAPRYARYFDRVRGLLDQYHDISGGKVRVSYLNPEPFSDTEDRAVAAGLRSIRLNQDGDTAYFGLVGANSTDNHSVIEFFAPDRERFLEYDLTKMIAALANPKRVAVGLMSGLPIQGGVTPRGEQTPPWQVVAQMREVFDVYPLDQNLKQIPDVVDLLMIVQPDELTEQAAYAIDQFVLAGGRVLAFVDPLSEEGGASPYGATGEKSDIFGRLLAAWGVQYDSQEVATDLTHARRVQFATGPDQQPTITDHIAWLALDARNIEQSDVLASGIEKLNLATAGVLRKKEGSAAVLTPIVQTSPQSMVVDAAEFGYGSDPVKLLREFHPLGKPLTIAARISGKVSTAFPEGPPEPQDKQDKQDETAGAPGADAKEAEAPEHDAAAKPPQKTQGEINAIVVADTDMLNDRFWVDAGNFLGQQVMVPNAHNATFVLNALDNLSGNSALVSLRGRGVDDRPFVMVEGLRKKAEQRYRQKEEALVARLGAAREQLAAMESKSGEGDAILSEADRKAIEGFRRDIVSIRRELREVKRALREDIDTLEGTLEFANIAGVPLIIALGGLAVAIVRRRRRSG